MAISLTPPLRVVSPPFIGVLRFGYALILCCFLLSGASGMAAAEGNPEAVRQAEGLIARIRHKEPLSVDEQEYVSKIMDKYDLTNPQEAADHLEDRFRKSESTQNNFRQNQPAVTTRETSGKNEIRLGKYKILGGLSLVIFFVLWVLYRLRLRRGLPPLQVLPDSGAADILAQKILPPEKPEE